MCQSVKLWSLVARQCVQGRDQVERTTPCKLKQHRVDPRVATGLVSGVEVVKYPAGYNS